MGLKAVIKSLEDVEEAVRGLYVKGQDGRFFLDVDAVEGVALENVDGLRNTVKATRDERDALAIKTKAFDGIDPDKARDALKKVGEMDDWNPEKKNAEYIKRREIQMTEQFDGQRKQLKAEFDTQLSESETKSKQLFAQLSESMIVQESLKLLPAITDAPHLMLSHIKERTRLVPADNGTHSVEVINPVTGDMRYSTKPGASMTPMGLDELVGEIAVDPMFELIVKTQGASGGSGSTQSQSRITIPGGVKRVKSSDAKAMSENMEGIANGTVVVED